jgi:hypothetical protein
MTSAGPESEKCGAEADLGQDTGFEIRADGGYLKWVFTGGDAGYVKLNGPWGTFDMIQTPGGGAWHKATAYYPLSDLVPDEVYAEHEGTGNVQLVVSNGCAGGTTTPPRSWGPDSPRTPRSRSTSSVTCSRAPGPWAPARV